MCAVFGAFNVKEAARITYFGLYSLQHRGQESSGIVSSDGSSLRVHKGSGLVARVFNEKDFEYLKGNLAIGHNRYGTSGGGSFLHSQPVHRKNSHLALAHNGNFPTLKKIKSFLKDKGLATKKLNDSELVYELINFYLHKDLTLEESIKTSLPLLNGAFCLLILTPDKLAAFRDPCGIRPLCIGRANGGYVFSSETCALNTVNAKFIRYVKPGELVVASSKGLKSYQLFPPNLKLDIFEFVYFARPDSILLGKSVNEIRRNLGRQLAKEVKIKADIVIPVPDSAIPAAFGFSEQSGIKLEFGLIKNRYVHRTFIQPTQKLREREVEMKLNPLRHVLEGKEVIVIDDSIVRGTTSKRIVSILRRAGAKAVHLLISSPPVKYPDFYGINTPNQKDLIANNLTLEQITKFIGADSLHYLSYKGLIDATGLPEKLFCTSCFTGNYPIDIGEKKNGIIYDIKVGAGSEENRRTYL